MLTTSVLPSVANLTQAADNNSSTISDEQVNSKQQVTNKSQVTDQTAAQATQATQDSGHAISTQNSDPTVSPVSPAATPAISPKMVTEGTFATTSTQQAFIQKIAPYAQQAANSRNLYPSVMMAQAILESGWGTSALSQAPNYNLFGIKGSYNGASVDMPTLEWINGQYVSVDAYFRKYPSYLESFNDNGDKLRYGVSWDSSYYSGTWRENTTSYRDATSWLQGRYATDPTYASKLNDIIDTYNLTQYDNTAAADATVPSGGSATTGNTSDNLQPGQVQTFRHVVRTTNVVSYAWLYDENGTRIEARVLPKNTDWKADKVKNINGYRYYRVAGDEWVLANDVTVMS